LPCPFGGGPFPRRFINSSFFFLLLDAEHRTGSDDIGDMAIRETREEEAGEDKR
jgi:hypothetical protein